VTFTHDTEGNRTGLTNGRGQAWTFVFDPLNCLAGRPRLVPGLDGLIERGGGYWIFWGCQK